MYTTKNFRDDLYEICKKHYVKFNLLQDVATKRMTLQNFSTTLQNDLGKTQMEIADIFTMLQNIVEKIQQNGGRLSEDPFKRTTDLRKAGRLDEALQVIFPIIQSVPSNQDAVITFGWLIYDYLKLSEQQLDRYLHYLTLFNDYAMLPFSRTSFGENESITILKNSFLWSMRRVINANEAYADRLIKQIIRFCGQGGQFVEHRLFHGTDKLSASRLLIKDIRKYLNDANYLAWMDCVGFEWFDQWDYNPSIFNKDGETITSRPLAEIVLNYHAKRLGAMQVTAELTEKINHFINILEAAISKNPTFEWLPYYKVKLLMKVNRKEEALQALVDFARMKSKDFWVWGLLSELVEGDRKFHCLCAALLCKTKPEMLVGMQEKVVPHLVEKGLYKQAKYELDQLIAVRRENWGKVSEQITNMRDESWYGDTVAAKNRESLQTFAEQAEAILYETLPYQDIFVTYVNEEKGAVNFAFVKGATIVSGYFYSNAIESEQDWQVDKVFKVKMLEDKKRSELYKLYEAMVGDASYAEHFIQSDEGCVEQGYGQSFAFVNDAYISKELVKTHGIEDGDQVSYRKKRMFNKRKNRWGWAVIEISAVKKEERFDFEY